MQGDDAANSGPLGGRSRRNYAYAPKDDAHAIAHNAWNPISSAEAGRIISRVRAAFLPRFGGALPVRTQKVRAFSDLPQAIRTSAAAQGIQATAAHVAYGGAAHIEKAVFHHASALSNFGASSYMQDVARVVVRMRGVS